MREIKNLVYKGNRDKGELLVRREKPTSKFRKFKYWKLMRLRIGRDVPEEVANNVVLESNNFKIVKDEISNEAFLDEELYNFFHSRVEVVEPDQLVDMVMVVLCQLDDGFEVAKADIEEARKKREKAELKKKRVTRAKKDKK